MFSMKEAAHWGRLFFLFCAGQAITHGSEKPDPSMGHVGVHIAGGLCRCLLLERGFAAFKLLQPHHASEMTIDGETTRYGVAWVTEVGTA
jgi:hypothetical protein